MPLAWTNRLLKVLVNPAGSLGAVDTEPNPSGTDLDGEAAAEAGAIHPPSSEPPATAAPVPTKPRRENRREGPSASAWVDDSVGEMLMAKLL
jgi:hypothetical protein